MQLPNHVAIIMDGNGRWANSRKHNRVFGHIRGAKVAYDIIEKCAQINLKHLTLYAFSTENWSRPKTEVSLLMALLIKHLKKEKNKLINNNISFHTIGDSLELPAEVQALLSETSEETKNNTGLKLTFALNYGGRQEIINATKNIYKAIKSKSIAESDISEELFEKFLQSAFLPNPDLIIRTSNEKRLSNFFLWQAAYSEFYFCDKFWPDFNFSDFELAINDYNKRQRRFGNIENQPSLSQNNFISE